VIIFSNGTTLRHLNQSRAMAILIMLFQLYDQIYETQQDNVGSRSKFLTRHYIKKKIGIETFLEQSINSCFHPQESISDDSTQDTSSKDSPAPAGIITSPEDSLLEPPTEDSMDVNTGNEESSSQDVPEEEAKEESLPAAAAPAPEPIVAEKEPEPAAEEPKQQPPQEPEEVAQETTTTTTTTPATEAAPVPPPTTDKEAALIEDEPSAKRPKVDGGED
jgi:hypothetical protein